MENDIEDEDKKKEIDLKSDKQKEDLKSTGVDEIEKEDSE